MEEDMKAIIAKLEQMQESIMAMLDLVVADSDLINQMYDVMLATARRRNQITEEDEEAEEAVLH